MHTQTHTQTNTLYHKRKQRYLQSCHSQPFLLLLPHFLAILLSPLQHGRLPFLPSLHRLLHLSALLFLGSSTSFFRLPFPRARHDNPRVIDHGKREEAQERSRKPVVEPQVGVQPPCAFDAPLSSRLQRLEPQTVAAKEPPFLSQPPQLHLYMYALLTRERARAKERKRGEGALAGRTTPP